MARRTTGTCPRQVKKYALTLVELLVTIAIVTVVAAVLIPRLRAAHRESNERRAAGTLKQLGSIQVTFKCADMDANGCNDYWVHDIAGLYYISPVSPSTPTSIVRLIEPAVALADGDTVPGNPQTPRAVPPGMTHGARPGSGYWYFALDSYEKSSGAFVPYASGSEMVDRYGVTAVPAAWGSSARKVYILSEEGTMYQKDPRAGRDYMRAPPVPGAADTNGALTPEYSYFPLMPYETRGCD